MRRLFMQSLAIGINENLPNSIKIAKVGSKICQTLHRAVQNCPKLLEFCQSGDISPDLVTLFLTQKMTALGREPWFSGYGRRLIF